MCVDLLTLLRPAENCLSLPLRAGGVLANSEVCIARAQSGGQPRLFDVLSIDDEVVTISSVTADGRSKDHL